MKTQGSVPAQQKPWERQQQQQQQPQQQQPTASSWLQQSTNTNPVSFVVFNKLTDSWKILPFSNIWLAKEFF